MQILKLHPQDKSNTLSHSKLAQSLYTYPEDTARNRRTVNLTESVQNLFQDLQILKLHLQDNSNTLSHSKLAQSLCTHLDYIPGNRMHCDNRESTNLGSRSYIGVTEKICVYPTTETIRLRMNGYSKPQAVAQHTS